MAKVNMKGFEKAMAKAFDTMESATEMRLAGEFVVDRIVKRTRLGKGVEQDGADPQQLKSLSQSYRDFRKGKLAFFTKGGVVVPYKPKQGPKLDESTSASKSNLTLTGQMLKSIKVIVARTGSVLVGPTGSRRSAFGGKSLTSNKEVAGFVSIERPFLNLSKPEKAGLARYFKERLQLALKKTLT